MNAQEQQSEPADPPEIVSYHLEVWKQTVAVQQHFNDIEWRIRGLALTAATFAIGAAAVAAKDGGSFAGVVVLVIGLFLWFAFYFVDRYWYHPLLIGSVLHGHKVEEALRAAVPAIGLTRSISDASPVDRPPLVRWLTFGTDSEGAKRRATQLRSSEKLTWFYGAGAAALALAAVGLALVGLLADPQSPQQRVTFEIEQGHHPDGKSPAGLPTPTRSGPTP